MVGAADDVGDAGVVVVDDDREVVDGRGVGAGDDEVVLERVLELGLAAHDVDDGRVALVGDAQADGAGALVLAAEAAVAVRLLVRADLFRPGGRPVRMAAGEQLLDDLAVARGALRLEDRLAVPVDPEPLERLEDLRDVLRRGALAVGVLDPQHQLLALRPRHRSLATTGEQPVVEGGAGAADVEGAGGRRGEADAHGRPSMLEPPG